MKINQSIFFELTKALNDLQDENISLSLIAKKIGAKTGWIHKLKNESAGAETWRRLVALNNYILEHHPEKMPVEIEKVSKKASIESIEEKAA